MAVIYLKHPSHGSKIAISDLEALADEANGWEKYDPEQKQEVIAEIPSFFLPVVESPVEEVTNHLTKPKRGRRSKHIEE